ncbi:MAG: hypothetical protein L0Z68_07515 [Gammaproteobacteria bacterium]|nr:hypothetical protein [Gammaproteobacteria bacterium]
MNRRVNWVVIVVAMLPPFALGADETKPDEMPDLELLEFVGEWESAAEEWVDPAIFDDPILSEATDQSVGQDDE